MNVCGEGKKRWFPNVFTLLFLFSVLAAVLTWIIPAGSFERVTEGSTVRVVPGTFEFTKRSPQGIWEVLRALVTGFKNQASLVFMIFFVGAAVHLLEITEAINTIFAKIAFIAKGREGIAIFGIMLFLAFGGATGVFGNVTLVLIPIGIILSETMGLDKTLGFFMVFLGSFAGFNVGWMNPSTVGVAHTVAQLPMFSGMGVRIIIFAVNFSINYFFVYMYLRQIRKNPEKSLNYVPGMKTQEYMGSQAGRAGMDIKVTRCQAASMGIMMSGIAAVMYGTLTYGWGTDQIAAVFLGAAILIGLINSRDLNITMNQFIQGCSKIVTAAFVVGFANAISVIMKNGGILDTVVYYLSVPIGHFGAVAGANIMLLSNSLINFFITSGSGQASVVMPIMVPICDLTGITRQVAVQCYQFGDGLSNCIYPTVASLMGGLAFAGIGYGRYVKKAAPLFAVQILLAMLAVTILQEAGWTGL